MNNILYFIRDHTIKILGVKNPDIRFTINQLRAIDKSQEDDGIAGEFVPIILRERYPEDNAMRERIRNFSFYRVNLKNDFDDEALLAEMENDQ